MPERPAAVKCYSHRCYKMETKLVAGSLSSPVDGKVERIGLQKVLVGVCHLIASSDPPHRRTICILIVAVRQRVGRCHSSGYRLQIVCEFEQMCVSL